MEINGNIEKKEEEVKDGIEMEKEIEEKKKYRVELIKRIWKRLYLNGTTTTEIYTE